MSFQCSVKMMHCVRALSRCALSRCTPRWFDWPMTVQCVQVCIVQVYTEMVRLTNDNALREHTDEHGDLFLWFKHQASQGVVGAQVFTRGVYLTCRHGWTRGIYLTCRHGWTRGIYLTCRHASLNEMSFLNLCDTFCHISTGNESIAIQLALCSFPGWPFPMLKYWHIFQIKYMEAILSNSTQKLLWFEITKMLIAV